MRNLLKKRSMSEKFAEAIGNIAKEIVIIFIGIFVVIARILYRFRKFEWRLGLFVIIFGFLFINFQNFVEAPKVVEGWTPKVSPTPTPTQRQIILASPHSDILLRIWDNESGQGTIRTGQNNLQVYCESKGKTNEFGYNPQSKKCFSSFQQSVDTVSQWWTTCLKNSTLVNCLYTYSGDSQSYVGKFLNQ